MNNPIISMLDTVGKQSGYLYLLVVVGVFRLFERVRYLVAFLVICMINVNLVKCAKIMIREPRPQMMITDKTNPEYYGMPSGHAFHASFITTFLWMVRPSLTVLYGCIIVVCITLVERYIHKRHSINQLLAGLVSGSVFAYICVWVLRYYFEKNLL